MRLTFFYFIKSLILFVIVTVFLQCGKSDSVTSETDSKLPQPELLSPENGSEQSSPVTFRWRKTDEAESYQILISLTEDFSSSLTDSISDSTQFEIGGLPNDTTIHWKVRATDQNQRGPWSEVFTFSTEVADTVGPDLSISSTPPNASERDTVTVSATASDSSGISGIELYVDGDKAETCPESTTCSHSEDSYDIGSHSYHAIAVDASSRANQSRSEIKTFRIADGNAPGNTVKIMPLGNSITEAFGYRIPLWDKLTGAGCPIDYVGSQSVPHPDLPDTDHEGHGGWYIGHISKEINGWLAAYQPDYILLMIGTNDIAWWTPRNGAEIADAHAELVDQILANASPDTWLLVASIPPQSSKIIGPNNVDRAQLTRDFNHEMKKRMQQRIDDGKQVFFVDIHSSLSAGDLSDGIHPNRKGYEIIAQAWFEALLKVLS